VHPELSPLASGAATEKAHLHLAAVGWTPDKSCIRGTHLPWSLTLAPPVTRPSPQPAARTAERPQSLGPATAKARTAAPSAAPLLPADVFGGTRPVAASPAQAASFLALVGATVPRQLPASGYVAEFGAQGRCSRALIDGQGEVVIAGGERRGPTFHAEAGKPLTVRVDPSRVNDSAEKVELMWRVYPGGEEQAIPLTDGSRDPVTGKLNLTQGRIDVPPDAFGTLRLSLRSTSAEGKVTTSWDPSYDAHLAPREGATVRFGDDWKTQTEGALRAGDHLRLDYDLDRMTAMNGGVAPSRVTAFVAFNGQPPLEVPVSLPTSSAAFVPSLRIPFEATSAQIWFRGEGSSGPAWDSAEGRNFQLKIGPARDDADPSWKEELLRSKSFPNLKEESFVGIGPSAQAYNCIAWTLGITDEWVWPGTRVEDFDALYGQHGYRPLESVDLSLDPSLEKIVVYGLPPRRAHGVIEVTHGARMDDQGRLTSKIGTQPLIRHDSAQDLVGPSYGEPIRVYVRPRSGKVS